MRRLARLNLPVVRLVNALHARYRLVLLTNVSKSRYMENVDMGFFRKVKCDRVYASCYLRMSKPGQEIYRYVLEKERVRPEEAVFVDNLLVNVQGRKEGRHEGHTVRRLQEARQGPQKDGNQVVGCPIAWRGGWPGDG